MGLPTSAREFQTAPTARRVAAVRVIPLDSEVRRGVARVPARTEGGPGGYFPGCGGRHLERMQL
eukprot:2991841-Lingulodinium_polyedra.AAC.1